MGKERGEMSFTETEITKEKLVREENNEYSLGQDEFGKTEKHPSTDMVVEYVDLS
jgi:hypothetical protein